MKRIILTLVCAWLTLVCSAQHLAFMDIPIDGSLNNFKASLIDKGFTPDTTVVCVVGEAWFVGTVNQRPVTLVVNASDATLTPWLVTAFVQFDNNEGLMRAVDRVKDKLTADYAAACQPTNNPNKFRFKTKYGSITCEYRLAEKSDFNPQLIVNFCDHMNNRKFGKENKRWKKDKSM